ncbi:MAG: DUF433 domain-containing protein [Candidatus Binatia bacterium]
MEGSLIVTRDPDVVSGALVFTGTRVPVQILIDYLKAGETLDRFLDGFPTVSREQAEAFLEHAIHAVAAEVGDARPA